MGIATRAVGVVCSTLSTALATRYLGGESFGLLATITSLFILLSFTDQGIGAELVNRVARARAQGDDRAVQQAVSVGAVGLFLSAAFVGAAVLASFAVVSWPSVLHAPTGVSDTEVVLSLAVVAVFFLSGVVLGIAERLRAGLQQSWVSSLCGAVGSLVSLAALAIAVALQASFPYVIAAASCGLVLGQLLNAGYASRAFPAYRPRMGAVTRQQVIGLLRRSAPFALLNIFAAVAFFTDTLVVASTLGPVAAAEYAVPARAAAVMTSLLSFIALPLWPAYVDAAGRGEWWHVRAMFRKCMVRSATAGLLSALTLVAVGPELLRLWTGSTVSIDVRAVEGQAVWVFLFAIGSAINVLLSSQQRLLVQIKAYGLMAAVNLGLSLLLVRTVGVSGPIIATDVTYLLLAVLPLGVFARRLLRAGGALSPESDRTDLHGAR